MNQLERMTARRTKTSDEKHRVVDVKRTSRNGIDHVETVRERTPYHHVRKVRIGCRTVHSRQCVQIVERTDM
jgi:hypothetical protein